MHRNLVVPAALAAAILVPPSGRAAAAPRRDALHTDAVRALTSVRKSVRADESLFAATVRTAAADVRAQRKAVDVAAREHAAAVAFLLAKADAAADAASAELLDAAAASMADAGDASLRGAVPGDGGSLDAFEDAVQDELGRLRARVLVRARKFADAWTRTAGGISGLRTVVPERTFRLRDVAAPGEVLAGSALPPAVRAITTARFPDARVFLTVSGRADPSFTGAFDLRLRGDAVDVLPPSLAAGGVPVGEDGTWTVTVDWDDPFTGYVPAEGNRALQFGVEPHVVEGVGLREPGRLVFAGTLSIP